MTDVETVLNTRVERIIFIQNNNNNNNNNNYIYYFFQEISVENPFPQR